jgi:hypothetical protein
MRRVIALVALALVVMACLPSAGSSATPSATPTPVASPAGSTLTLAEAASAYSAVADPYNAALDRAQEQYGTRTSLEDHQRYWALLAKADKAFLAGLKRIAFPPEVAADAAVLIRADEAFQQQALIVSRARSLAEVISSSAVANAAAAVAAEKAAILREGLGLEPLA